MNKTLCDCKRQQKERNKKNEGKWTKNEQDKKKNGKIHFMSNITEHSGKNVKCETATTTNKQNQITRKRYE